MEALHPLRGPTFRPILSPPWGEGRALGWSAPEHVTAFDRRDTKWPSRATYR